MLKLAFNISSDEPGIHPDDLSALMLDFDLDNALFNMNTKHDKMIMFIA